MPTLATLAVNNNILLTSAETVDAVETLAEADLVLKQLAEAVDAEDTLADPCFTSNEFRLSTLPKLLRLSSKPQLSNCSKCGFENSYLFNSTELSKIKLKLSRGVAVI